MASPAPTLRALWEQVHGRWPDETRFDGIMGDASHQARNSDHNLGNAIDIGIIPERGPLGYELAELLIRDPRTKYVIWDRRIWAKDRASEGWRRYTGTSPHTAHVHLSIPTWARDDMTPWLTDTIVEDDMFDDQARAELDRVVQGVADAARRKPWAFVWGGGLHTFHVRADGGLVHSSWDGTQWHVEQVGSGCDPTVEPEVIADDARIRCFCRSADLASVVHTVYEVADQRWYSGPVTA